MNTPLDIYDDMPREMRRYLQYNGWQFNKKAYEFACSQMYKKKENSEKKEPVQKFSKEEVDQMLNQYGVNVERKGNYDYVFAAQMCRADYLGSSVPDNQHLARYVKDVCDDADAASGTTMRRWYATMVANGVSIPWEEFNE